MSWIAWTVTLVAYILSFVISCHWTRVELKKRSTKVRIIAFSHNGKMQHDRKKNSKQNNQPTLFLEQSLHRCSIAVYIASIIGCFSGIFKHVTVLCSFISQIQAMSFTCSKVFILLFQMKRYELCFKNKTNIESNTSDTNPKTTKKCSIDMFDTFYAATVISGSFACVLIWIYTKQLILNNNYCTWVAVNNTFFVMPVSFSVLDLFILGLFTHKILSLSKMLSQIKQQYEIPSVNVNNVNVNVKGMGVKSISSETSDAVIKESELGIEKLHKILKRLLILSLAMEFIYVMTLVAGATYAKTGTQLTPFVVLWNGLDMATNIKFISLMLQHNTELSCLHQMCTFF